jgi:hypothetical protein
MLNYFDKVVLPALGFPKTNIFRGYLRAASIKSCSEDVIKLSSSKPS